ncbi:hypothetical protein G4G28_11960 [Massilia sp. Dwa41.01b]|uniref:hypothetical protein n=1 Tax=Massilia sp. Dwa41.01b TaxID=2709302 RepID=UPI0016003882|nr:hypothetical protein [Massilia sp. Dwa41.01b]QNA89013.1 hypothetical protein G4G28_11960 [Massilia sp. Dwa41.01b]
MYPALQLYLATGETGYHTLFKASAQAIVAGTGAWPEQYLPGNSSASAQTAHFSSYLLQQAGRSTRPWRQRSGARPPLRR